MTTQMKTLASGIAIGRTTSSSLVRRPLTRLALGVTAAALSLGGSDYEHPAVDPTHGVFLLQEAAPPDFFGTAPNNNAMSAVDVIDEHGTLLQRAEHFNFFNIFLLDMGGYLQVSSATRTGYTLGPGGTQLAPFQY